MARYEREDDSAGEQPPLRPGAPIPPPLRHQLEVELKTDLSHVRLHSAHNVAARGAAAFTDGSDIHFQPGFHPYRDEHLKLLRHELAHVVQQRQGRVP